MSLEDFKCAGTGSASGDESPAAGQVLGILKQMKDDMEESHTKAIKNENVTADAEPAPASEAVMPYDQGVANAGGSSSSSSSANTEATGYADLKAAKGEEIQIAAESIHNDNSSRGFAGLRRSRRSAFGRLRGSRFVVVL